MKLRHRTRVAALLALLQLGSAAGSETLAQTGRPQAPTPGSAGRGRESGADLTIYLLTMGPGDAVWERFGHDAILVHDPVAGTDIAYNYGMFDFNAPHFYSNFVQGRMMYWMEGDPLAWILPIYRQENRTVWAQELSLTPPQRLELKRFLEWNARPENRFYRYDPFRDNCTTRVRDAIDRALGGVIRRATESEPSGTTYRWHTRILMEPQPAAYSGIELGLGEPTDDEITVWEEMFLPMQLMEQLRDIEVTGPDGRAAPLVKRELTLLPSDRPPLPSRPPTRWPFYLAIGIGLGLALALTGASAAATRVGRFAFTVLGTGWAAFVGIFGCVLVFLWGFTDHWATYSNENVLQFGPLSLALVPLLPLFALGRARSATTLAAAVVAGLAVIGFAMQPLPGLDQVNGEIIALALPAHVGLLVGVLAIRRRAAPVPDGDT